MSKKGWLKEFLPILDKETLMKKSSLELVEICITKYRGMLSENIQKHNLVIGDRRLNNSKGTEVVGVYSDHCPLCIVYSYVEDKGRCEGCPLDLADDCCLERGSSWSKIDRVSDVDTNMMIGALENSKKFIK